MPSHDYSIKVYDTHSTHGHRRFVEVMVASDDHHVLAKATVMQDCEQHLALALAELVRTGIVKRDALERMLGLAFDYVADRPPTAPGT